MIVIFRHLSLYFYILRYRPLLDEFIGLLFFYQGLFLRQSFLKETYVKNNEKYEIVKFTKEEHNKIFTCVREKGKDWAKVAQEFENRPPLTLRDRYYLRREKTKKIERRLFKQKP